MKAAVFIFLTLLSAGAVADDWKSYPIDKEFSVEMPTKPSHMEGAQLSISEEGNTFAGIVEDLQGLADHEGFGSFINELAVGENGGQVTVVTDILHNGWRGIEFRWVSEDIESWGQGFVIKGKLLVIQCSYTKADGAPKNAARFFASFKPTVTEAGPYKVAGPIFKTYESKEFGYQANHHGEPEVLQESKPGEPQTKAVVSRYANRAYLTTAGVLPSEFPPDATDDNVQELSDLLSESILKKFEFKKLKSSWKRLASDSAEIAFDGRGPKGLSARFIVTVKGQMIYVRGFIAPEAMLSGKHARDWFASYKLPKI